MTKCNTFASVLLWGSDYRKDSQYVGRGWGGAPGEMESLEGFTGLQSPSL